jgi:hypothetical protein
LDLLVGGRIRTDFFFFYRIDPSTLGMEEMHERAAAGPFPIMDGGDAQGRAETVDTERGGRGGGADGVEQGGKGTQCHLTAPPEPSGGASIELASKGEEGKEGKEEKGEKEGKGKEGEGSSRRTSFGFEQSISFPDYCKFSGINDRFAVVGRVAAPLYFETLKAYTNNTRAMEVYRYGFENHAKHGENPPEGSVTIDRAGIGIGGGGGGDGGGGGGGSRVFKRDDEVMVMATGKVPDKVNGTWYKGKITRVYRYDNNTGVRV